MPDLLLAIDYGGYTSPIKLIIFVILFFGWLPLINWVRDDADYAGLNVTAWKWIVFGAGAAGFLLSLLMPNFIVAVIILLALAGGSTLAYVFTRDGRLPDSEKIISVNTILRILSKEPAGKQTSDFVFVTVNGNEVPVPERKSSDYQGYQEALNLFKDATYRRADDIVLAPSSETYKVSYSIDGAVIKQPDIEKEQVEAMSAFLKKLAELDHTERRKPQKGNFKIEHDSKVNNWVLNTAGSRAGEQMKLKKEKDINFGKIETLEFSKPSYQKLDQLKDKQQGVFLITGPKKSGISTTMYGLIKNHDAFLNNINTLEINPTAELQNITQHVFSFSDSTVTTFSEKLREIARMGADIIGVEGVSDRDSAKSACEAALDGKIVYVTLEADSAVKAMGKWIKMVGDKDLASSSLLGISNQRLLRKLCEDCKEAYEPNRNLLKKFNLPAEKAKVLYRAGKVQYTRSGKPIPCDTCQELGYVGRIPVAEMVIISDELRDELKKAKSLKDIGNLFRKAKMLYLQEVALRRVMEGETAINEMVRVLSPSSNGNKRAVKK